MDAYLKLAFDEIFRKFDEFEARWDRRFSETQGARVQRAEDLRIGAPKPIDAEVVADNWGGLFDGDSNAADSGAHVVADNWGGLFDEVPAFAFEPVTAPDATDPVALLVDAAAPESTSTTVLEEIEPEESLPMEYPL